MAELTQQEGSEVFDEDTGACVIADDERLLIAVHSMGSQLFIHEVDDDPMDGLHGVMAADGSFSVEGGDQFISDGGVFDETTGTFSFSFNELDGFFNDGVADASGSSSSDFAGGTADAFTLFERFEAKLEAHNGQIVRAAVELAKDWRTDRALRRLEALLAVANKEASLIITGNGDVVQPENDLIAIGSGGNYAQAAATALYQNTELSAREIVEKSLTIAGDICVFTNQQHTIDEITF